MSASASSAHHRACVTDLGRLRRTYALAGTQIPIPAEAGIGITIATKGGQKDIRSIELQITGDEDALESIEVLDASGEKVSNDLSNWSLNDGPVQKSIDLDKPLDVSMRLVPQVALNRKVVTVPFDLKDVALP